MHGFKKGNNGPGTNFTRETPQDTLEGIYRKLINLYYFEGLKKKTSSNGLEIQF